MSWTGVSGVSAMATTIFSTSRSESGPSVIRCARRRRSRRDSTMLKGRAESSSDSQ